MKELTQTQNNNEKIEQNLTLLAQKIDNSYKEGIQHYTEALTQFNLEIKALKNQIETLDNANKQEEEKLKILEKEIDYEERFLQKLNENFTQKVNSIDELKTQYSHLIQNDEYNTILQKKINELQLALDEIEELEITLLQQELERVNLLILLNPKQQKILELKENLNKLELEQEYYALNKLHQLPQLAHENSNEIPVEIIETSSEALEVDK